MRNSLLSAAAGAALVRLSGFHRKRGGGGAAVGGVQAAELRLSAGNERLEALLAQAAPELAAGLREELAARERRHAAQDAVVATIVSTPANLVVLESANPCAPGA